MADSAAAYLINLVFRVHVELTINIHSRRWNRLYRRDEYISVAEVMSEVQQFKSRFEDEIEKMKKKIFIHIGYPDMILMPNEEEDWEVYTDHEVASKVKAMSYYGVILHIGSTLANIEQAIHKFETWTKSTPTVHVEQQNHEHPNDPYSTIMTCAWPSRHLLQELTNMKMILMDAIDDDEMLKAYADPEDTKPLHQQANMYMRRRHNFYARLHTTYKDLDWQEFINDVANQIMIVNMNDERLMIGPLPFLHPQLFFE